MKKEWEIYLKSEHWLKFRGEILSYRNRCQNCLIKKNLTVHHKHYRTVGSESSGDVIVLCWNCHLRFHRKGKWVEAKKKGKIMDFTKTREPWRAWFNRSEVFRNCKRCGGEHPVFYKKRKDGKICLVIACPNSNPHNEYIKTEKGLPIPIY